MKAYNALLAKSTELNLPKHFSADLTKHDRKALESAREDERFLWALGVEGTHLIWLDRPHHRYTAVQFARMVTKSFPDVQWFIWTGSELQPTTLEDMT